MKSSDSNDKFFEERFDPKLHIIGESQFQDHDRGKENTPASKYIRIEFSETIKQETKQFLSVKLPEIIDFPSKSGFRINYACHLLRFTDQATYETEIGSLLPKNVSLPASRIDSFTDSRSFKVTIILPNDLETAEIIVNITRNVFSKLFGRIFFNEQILPLEFYRQNVKEQKTITASIPEILDLVEEFEFQSDSLDGHFERIANSYRFSMEKDRDQIRKKLTHEWREKWKNRSMSTEEQQTLTSIFAEFKELFWTNPEQYTQQVSDQIKHLDTQLHFILPHEKQVYKQFEIEHFTHYIRSVLHKLEEISALVGFIQELHDQFKKPIEFEELKEVGTQIRHRMQQLRKDEKVFLFYVTNMPQNSELDLLRQKFTFRMIKMLPSGTPLREWSQGIKKIEKYYTESIFSKLYFALYSLSKWTKFQNESMVSEFLESDDALHLKTILSVLKFRLPEIKSIQSFLGVLLDIRENTVLKSEPEASYKKQYLPLNDFRKAWSYFSASVLTLLYYKKFSESAGLPQGFRADNYLKSILEFVDKQCSLGVNYYHIVKLLWLIYKKLPEKDALGFMLYCIQNPQDILRYTLHQVMRPLSDKSTIKRRLEKLPDYRDALITAYQNRILEALV